MRFVIRTLAVFGLVFILILALMIYGVARLRVANRAPPPIDAGAVLTLTVEGPFI